jgi:hypothetical protein
VSPAHPDRHVSRFCSQLTTHLQGHVALSSHGTSGCSAASCRLKPTELPGCAAGSCRLKPTELPGCAAGSCRLKPTEPPGCAAGRCRDSNPRPSAGWTQWIQFPDLVQFLNKGSTAIFCYSFSLVVRVSLHLPFIPGLSTFPFAF